VTDWNKDIDGGGTMRIRDLGSTVEFWFKAAYSSDWYNGLDFSYTVNGDTTKKSINYPTGADWHKVGSDTATYNQTVTFKLLSDTNISGIGGPATFTHSVTRDTVPGAPSTPTISGIKATSVVVSFKDGSNGGDAIDSRQIRYDDNTSASSPAYVSSDGSTTISGLISGKTYYFWARTHNSVGWGPWSGRAGATTQRPPTAPQAPLLSSVTATTVDVSFYPTSDGGSAITAWQIGWGTSSSTPDSFVSATSPQVLPGLTPGTNYYIFVRAQNSVGWSAWSKPTMMTTVAGAYVLVGTTRKLAIPYVNVGGTWKMAEAWGRSAGTWSRAT
jgi:Fibronectin type III domain.